MEHNYLQKCAQHKNQLVQGVCMEKKCSQPDRLVCFECAIKLHSSHSSQIVTVQEIFETKQVSKNWPTENDPQGKKIKDFLVQLKSLQEKKDIEQIFQNFLADIQQTSKKVEREVQESFENKELVRQKFMNRLESEFKKAYTLEGIQVLLTEYANGNLNLQEVRQNVNDFLYRESDEKKDALAQLSELMKHPEIGQFVSFDERAYQKMRDTCINAITEFGYSFKSDKGTLLRGFGFELIQVKNWQSLEWIEQGKRFKMNEKCVVVSDKILAEGHYKFALKQELYTSGCIVFGLERNDNLLNSNYWGQNPMVCISCPSLDAISFQLTQGNYLGHCKGTGSTFRVEINFEQNLFRVTDDSGANAMAATTPFKGQQWRFFINNYSGIPVEWNLTECERL